MVCLYLNSILFNERKVVPTSRMIFYTSTFEMVNFPLEREKGCQFCGEAEDEEEMKKEEEGNKEKVIEKAKEEEKEKEKIENGHTVITMPLSAADYFSEPSSSREQNSLTRFGTASRTSISASKVLIFEHN